MRKTLTYTHIAGIPLKVHVNWFLIMGLFTWSLSAVYLPFRYPGWDPATYWLVGSTASILFFVSVLAHELGHAMVAIREGVGVNSITLFIFGGVAHIANEPANADSDFRIVVSGPFASLTLGAGFYLLGLVTITLQPLSEISFYLAYMNFLLAVFNLIPGFPLDGGRIFRALVWKISGDYVKATQWATAGGFAIAILIALVGFGALFAGSIFAGIYLVFVGGYLGFVARDSYLQAKLTNHFQDRIVEEQRKQNQKSISPQLKVSHSAFGTVFILTGAGDSEDEISIKRGKK